MVPISQRCRDDGRHSVPHFLGTGQKIIRPANAPIVGMRRAECLVPELIIDPVSICVVTGSWLTIRVHTDSTKPNVRQRIPSDGHWSTYLLGKFDFNEMAASDDSEPPRLR